MSNTRRTAANWKKAKLHDVVLPSGFTVTIQIPDLTAMIQTGAMPQQLLDVAIKAAKGEMKPEDEMTVEMAAKEQEFKRLIVLATVVEPSIEAGDLDDLPSEDFDMIVEFATRQREFDMEGNHIAGLHSSAQFRKFRGLSSLYEDVEGDPVGE